MRSVSLVILAAGNSTRFGRPKQWEPVGPKGEAVLDITLRDAFAHGCDEARIVVRPGHADMARERYQSNPLVKIMEQPEPSGTGHAALVGMEHAVGTCIVANGDDLYGRESLRIAMEHARDGQADEHALVAFGLGRTLSPSGPVNRAACRNEGDRLAGIEEVTGLRLDAGGEIRDGSDRTWKSDAPVSMNLWVFRERFGYLLAEMHRGRAPMPAAELGLPDAVEHALAAGHAFRVLRTPDAWHGLTFAADADLVRRTLAQQP
ncbi:MAG: NTP transferase domain-containing protein [Flavobacteriales bacterium]|jgi:CTP:molybdopterin cytidylyltransferase MocA|nr:NTP transferase domain-containing protein [Flavobacteriales bacterium]